MLLPVEYRNAFYQLLKELFPNSGKKVIEIPMGIWYQGFWIAGSGEKS